MFSGYGVRRAVAFGSNEINPITNPSIFRQIVCSLFVSFDALIVSIFFYLYTVQYMHVFYIVLAADFYRAMLCIRGTSHGPVSVSICVCVCHKSEFY